MARRMLIFQKNFGHDIAICEENFLNSPNSPGMTRRFAAGAVFLALLRSFRSALAARRSGTAGKSARSQLGRAIKRSARPSRPS